MRTSRAMAAVGCVILALCQLDCSDPDAGSRDDVRDGDVSDAREVTFVNDIADVQDDVALDVSGWPACATGAEPGCPCDSNAQCNSGFCVPSEHGAICTASCVTSCPTDFACAPVATGVDVTYICVPRFTNLCRPCDGNADCAALGDVGGRCLPSATADGARFCGGNCGPNVACPSGYRCDEIEIGGSKVSQCVPADGICQCNDLAISDEAATGCKNVNSFGTCLGVRGCSDEGLSDCNAPVPALEMCNGRDDDCDGRTDDLAPEPCSIDNVYGSCPGTRSCVAGGWSQCLGTPPGPELCDGLDNDCDGLTDEGTPDSDGDGINDECELDDDNDGVPDAQDNCPTVANPGQETCGDTDGLGNTCDDDDDGDGTLDAADCAPCDATIHPGAKDSCNSLDDDCDGQTDEDCHTRLTAVGFASGFVLDGHSAHYRAASTIAPPITTGLGSSPSFALRPVRHVGALP